MSNVEKIKTQMKEVLKKERYYGKMGDKYRELENTHSKRLYKLSEQLSQLTHQYQKGDWIVYRNTIRIRGSGGELETRENYLILQIRKLIGTKGYTVNNYRFYNGSYTEPTINEKDVVCKVDKLKEYFELVKKVKK